MNPFLAQLDALEAQCNVLAAAVDALLHQARALRAGMEPEPEAPRPTCPRCGSTDLAKAGDVQVCGSCGANSRGSEVVSG